eukprot:TRINITY_DN2121_c0_g1_i1.p1 TRINITY_DN2121_c0_g1~~TRINITY_DN2121_c0_g1_i1.p1  ORF type:complete len:103 (+),score=9.15 TRINITY_DN2121_c0_g1_i1:294-602(+)
MAASHKGRLANLAGGASGGGGRAEGNRRGSDKGHCGSGLGGVKEDSAKAGVSSAAGGAATRRRRRRHKEGGGGGTGRKHKLQLRVRGAVGGEAHGSRALVCA